MHAALAAEVRCSGEDYLIKKRFGQPQDRSDSAPPASTGEANLRHFPSTHGSTRFVNARTFLEQFDRLP
jgi:hypothetical protein